MITELLDNWFSSAKKALFKYKDGFYELPYLANSPEIVIKSLTKSPFVKHSEKKGVFGSNNPFMQAEIKYHKIDEGLWIMDAVSFYKENVAYKRDVDNQLSSDYYNLMIEYSKTESNCKNALFDGVAYPNCSWVLFKSNGSLANCRFKGEKTRTLSLFFNDQWLKNVLSTKDFFQESSIKHFFDSKIDFIIWPDRSENAEFICNLSSKYFHQKIEQGIVKPEEWKEFVFKFFSSFINKYNEDSLGKNLINFSNTDRLKILETEKILVENLRGAFIGIDLLAARIGISPTKLKNNFKLVFGETIFQYFRKKQMEEAKILLEQKKEICIKEIAAQFGYNNPGKFSLAYKEHFGVLPSKI